MLESLILWLGVEDPFFKFLIAFGGLVTILILAILIPSIIIGGVLGLFSRLLFPKRRLSNPLFYYPGPQKKKKGSSDLFSPVDNKEKWTQQDQILKFKNKNSSGWF